jgi:ketosteroid isomerase-like protein
LQLQEFRGHIRCFCGRYYGYPYDNHFVSVITIKDRKVTRWRDYLDPVAVFNALGWPA